MGLRTTSLLVLLTALPGCISPRLVVESPKKNLSVAKNDSSVRFQELPSAPGEFVATHATTESLPRESVLSPARAMPVSHYETNPLLAPKANPDPPLVGAFREYFDGHTERALEKIKDLDTANQQIIVTLWSALVHANKADLSGRSPTDAAVLASQLDSAVDAVAKLAPLKIRKTCFVCRVSQFGIYDPVPEKYSFLPGGYGALYLEVQNAPSVPAELPAGGKGYVTNLVWSYYLADAEGTQLAAPRTFPHGEFTRSPVKDYFLKIEFDVPPKPGVYSLVVDVIDPATKRKAQQKIELKVGS
jgi:hypothetical protein